MKSYTQIALRYYLVPLLSMIPFLLIPTEVLAACVFGMGECSYESCLESKTKKCETGECLQVQRAICRDLWPKVIDNQPLRRDKHFSISEKIVGSELVITVKNRSNKIIRHMYFYYEETCPANFQGYPKGKATRGNDIAGEPVYPGKFFTFKYTGVGTTERKHFELGKWCVGVAAYEWDPT